MKIKFETKQTFASEANADKAVEKKGFSDLRYFVYRTEQGRFIPVFVGEAAVHRGVHFHFTVVG